MLQHNMADVRLKTPGLMACLRGLWRGRSRAHAEIHAPKKNTAEITD